MTLRASRFALVACAVSLTAACSSATTPDAGDPGDGAARADALVHPDATVGPDLGPATDGGVEGDATFPDAAAPPDDAGLGDAGPGDTGAGDATPVDPCGPLDPSRGPARFIEALGAWVARCNPELTPNEALSISQFVSFVAAPAFENVTLTYDPTAAGQCGCALAAAPCDSLAWFRALDACDAAFVSTATTGDACSTDFDCPTRHRCAEPQKDVAFAGLLAPLLCGRGVCQRFVGLGERCDGLDCAPGTHCSAQVDPPVCAANAALGEDCSDRPCIGDVGQVFILPPNQCQSTKGASTCLARGRAGGTCQEVECQELYRCDDNLDCQLMPGEGDACPTSFDSANPTLLERELLIHEATYACRGNLGVGIGAGTYCTQTGTTTGPAVCRVRPVVGQPCGIGPNLAPYCAPDAFCPGIDPQTFAPVTSACILRRTETSTCGGRPFGAFAPNQECEPGTVCSFDVGTGESRCADVCGG